jgi:hypothetical protein
MTAQIIHFPGCEPDTNTRLGAISDFDTFRAEVESQIDNALNDLAYAKDPEEWSTALHDLAGLVNESTKREMP